MKKPIVKQVGDDLREALSSIASVGDLEYNAGVDPMSAGFAICLAGRQFGVLIIERSGDGIEEEPS